MEGNHTNQCSHQGLQAIGHKIVSPDHAPHLGYQYQTCVPQSVYLPKQLWQSRIKIEYNSVAYFERITEFEAL